MKLKLIQGDNLLTLKNKRPKFDDCDHKQGIIDSKLNIVTCGKCGAQLNPIWYLSMLALEESRFSRERERYLEVIEHYESRKRTKCEHCGKMTSISFRKK
jgi:ribosomal protein S27E